MSLLKSTMKPPLDRYGKPIPSNRFERWCRARFVEKGQTLANFAREIMVNDANVRKALTGEWANGEVSQSIVQRALNAALAHDIRWLTAEELALELGTKTETAQRILANQYYCTIPLKLKLEACTETTPRHYRVLWDLTTNKPAQEEIP